MRLVFIFLLCSYSLSAQLWIRLPDFPADKRDDGVAVAVNGKAYFGTGLIEWANTIDFYALDLSNYSWTRIANMPNTTERQYACAFAGPNCFYVFGGEGVGGPLNNMYKYDIATDTWTAVASKPGGGLIGASCMNFGDKVIISGGKFIASGNVSDEVWEYTISTDTWQQKNDYPFAGRWRASASVLNGFGYLIFGRDTGGAYRKELYKYTPSTDSWNKIMDFPQTHGRAYSSLNVANNELFLFGGYDTLEHYYKDIWYFKEATTSWIQGPDLPSTGRRGGLNCAWGGNFFYSCGLGEGPVRLTETWMTDIPVGIKENTASRLFSVYPNPTGGILNIELPEKSNGLVSCSYSDLSRRELGSVKNIGPGTRLDLSSLSSGIYILTFYSEGRLIETQKIIRK